MSVAAEERVPDEVGLSGSLGLDERATEVRRSRLSDQFANSAMAECCLTGPTRFVSSQLLLKRSRAEDLKVLDVFALARRLLINEGRFVGRVRTAPRQHLGRAWKRELTLFRHRSTCPPAPGARVAPFALAPVMVSSA